MNKSAEAAPMPKDLRLDVLKAFLDQKTSILNNLSERSFTTALQAITLNVIVVAAMASGKVELSLSGQRLGSVVLVAFNMSIAWYLYWKAKSHHAARSQLWSIEQAMAHAARLTQDFHVGRPGTFWPTFFKGSGVMIFAVLVAGIAPPMPEAVVARDGRVVFARDDIERGRQVWQSIGGQQLGSIWGHGALVAPDWSADWLHREAMALVGLRAQRRARNGVRRSGEGDRAKLEAELRR
jgi:hypothetical protein